MVSNTKAVSVHYTTVSHCTRTYIHAHSHIITQSHLLASHLTRAQARLSRTYSRAISLPPSSLRNPPVYLRTARCCTACSPWVRRDNGCSMGRWGRGDTPCTCSCGLRYRNSCSLTTPSIRRTLRPPLPCVRLRNKRGCG